jgi:hypothetical protein
MKAWFDPRAVVLALALAVAAALPFMTTSSESRDFYLFDVTLTSPIASTTQLFWDSGGGFREDDSSRQPLKVEPKPVVYRYMMPIGRFQALRLDPADGPGTLTLSHAQIVDDRGRVVRTFRPDDFIAANQIARLTREGDTLVVETTPDARDPNLLLRLREPLVLPNSARIWYRFAAPVAWPVFLVGLLLGCPVVAGWLERRLRPVAGWVRARPLRTIALAAAAAVVVQSHPVLFRGRSFASPVNGALMFYGQQPTLPGMTEDHYTSTMSSDVGAFLFQHLYYPMVQRDALLKDGELPLWNRYSLCGEPLLGQGQSMFGDPLNFLTILADSAPWAWDARFVLAHWLLAAGLGFTAWRLTRHLAATLLVTVGGAFVGFFTFRLVHPANFSVCYAPWILWAWTGLAGADRPRRELGWLLALLAANWIEFTSGTVKEAYMFLACLNFPGVTLLWLLPGAGRRARHLGLAAAAGAVFVLLAAPWWMSLLTALRASFTGYENPSQADALPLAHLLGFFDDIFHRQTQADERVVAPALNVLFMLGVLGWLASGRAWRRDRAGLALLLAALPPLALAFGLVPPSVIIQIPVVRTIVHVGTTFSCPLMIVAALLAGCGFRDALERLGEDRWWPVFGRLAAMAGGLAVAYFITTRGFPKSLFFHGYVPALAIAAFALPLGARWAAKTGRPGPLYVALALGVPLLLWRHAQFTQTVFEQYAFVPGARHALRAPSPAAAFIDRERREPGRVVGWETHLYPSYNTALRWEGLYGVDAVRNPWYQELAVACHLEHVWVWDWSNDEREAPRLVPVHDMLNVAWYLATHRDGPARDIAGLQPRAPADLDVYSSPTAWPRAFFTDRLAVYPQAGDFAALLAGRAQAGDRRPFAAVQSGDALPAQLPAALEGREVRAATGYRLTANRTAFTVDAPGPGVAVLTECYYPQDFRVTVDGRRAAFFRVNHAFKGVVIPEAGRHEIVFAYWPQYFTLALMMNAIGVLALAAGGWAMWNDEG